MTRDEIIGKAQTGGGMFAVMPSVVMKDKSLSMSAKMLYGVITWKCNEFAFCWSTNRALGEELGLSAKRISALLSDLEASGHIETEMIRDEETGQIIRRNIYPIVKSSRGYFSPPLKNEDTPIPENGDTPPHKQGDPIPENGDTSPHKQGDPIPENEEEKHKEETKKENNPLNPPEGDKPDGRQGKARKSKYTLADDAKPILRAYVGHDKELACKLAEFVRMREQLRAINSKDGIAALLKKLDKLSGGNRDLKLQLVDESLANSWKSVFPLKSQAKGAPPPQEVRYGIR